MAGPRLVATMEAAVAPTQLLNLRPIQQCCLSVAEGCEATGGGGCTIQGHTERLAIAQQLPTSAQLHTSRRETTESTYIVGYYSVMELLAEREGLLWLWYWN